MTSTTPQKKSRLSSIFGAKKSKDQDLAPIGTNHALHPSTSTASSAPQPDSAYASSNHPSSKRNSVSANPNAESNSHADVVPVENTGSIEGVGPERNLAYNTSTGQVVDDDTGQVVVTTTTTTTTTMSTRGGKKDTKVQVQTQRENQPAIAEAPGDMPSMSSTTSHSPVPPPGPSSGGIGHPPQLSSPIPHNNGAPQQYTPPRNNSDYVPVPARNPMREREPMDPVSPLRPNFSYPSRTDIREEPMPAPAPKSTFANLKAAAQGLHVSLHKNSRKVSSASLTHNPGRRRNRPRHSKQRNRHPLPSQQHPKSRRSKCKEPKCSRRRRPRDGWRERLPSLAGPSSLTGCAVHATDAAHTFYA